MLSYLTEPLRKLFSTKNANTHKRKREKCSMIPLDCEEDQPSSKRCRRTGPGSTAAPADLAKPRYLPGSRALGNYIQDWFAKIGQMATKPLEPFNIDHVRSADDYGDAPDDDDDEDGLEPDIVELEMSNGGKTSNPYAQVLTREPLHSESRTLNVATNGHDEKLWGDIWEDVDEPNDVVVIPCSSRNGNGSVHRKSSSRRAPELDESHSDYSLGGSTVPSFFRRYCSRRKTQLKSSTPLEPIRLGEKEQYRMLLEQCRVGGQMESGSGKPRWSGSQSSTSSQPWSKLSGVSKVTLSEVTKRGLMDRLNVDLEVKSALRESRVRPQNSFGAPKYQPFGTDVSDSIVGSLHPKQLDVRPPSKSNVTAAAAAGQHAQRHEQKEAESLVADKVERTKAADFIQRRRSMPVTQKALFSSEWLNDVRLSVDDCCKSRAKEEEKLERITREFREKREAKIFDKNRKSLHRLVKSLNLKTTDITEEEEEDSHLPELTPEMEHVIDESLRPTPPKEVLCEGFRLSIARRDMETLAGLNWLNDEIINFYMNLLMERGKNDNFPSVYAFNTFFYPKLTSGGHAALRRWTRQVDIFSYRYVLIPVHLGMHWCLAVIDFVQKKIQYYDSMGGHNNECVNALKSYLRDESKDKKSEEFDLSDWKFETVKNIPQQMNGSDCGMFTLKYAEYITRNAEITFSQRHMPYFRRRMVYEIVTKTLL